MKTYAIRALILAILVHLAFAYALDRELQWKMPAQVLAWLSNERMSR